MITFRRTARQLGFAHPPEGFPALDRGEGGGSVGLQAPAPGCAGSYNLNVVSRANCRARAEISFRVTFASRCTPNFSTVKLANTEP